jgi:hypothetical protein
MYGVANRKVLEESCKKIMLILLTTGYRPRGIDVWSRKQKSASRKLQEMLLLYCHGNKSLAIDVRRRQQKVLEEICKKMALLSLTKLLTLR